ncbi:MAG: histidine triad nucleotide-binding protein [Desulfomonile sp.]|nr:histidine triad nucleotide-binding protein [Desulfomonile sp.]
MECVFCKIVQGIMPATRVYEDDLVVAFEDANPAAPIHILIVPRAHYSTLNDIPDDDPLLAHLLTVARRVAEQNGIAQSGYRVLINVNRGGGQVVFHLHVHLVGGRSFGQRVIHAAVGMSIMMAKVANLFRGRS